MSVFRIFVRRRMDQAEKNRGFHGGHGSNLPTFCQNFTKFPFNFGEIPPKLKYLFSRISTVNKDYNPVKFLKSALWECW